MYTWKTGAALGTEARSDAEDIVPVQQTERHPGIIVLDPPMCCSVNLSGGVHK